MSSPEARSSSSEKPSWFKDSKTGCEKQTDYFLRIRKLQKELINREQHNLVNAMERLKQLQYPRRKPVVQSFTFSRQIASTSFPARPLNARRRVQQRHVRRPGLEEIKPLRGQHLLPDNVQGPCEEELDLMNLEEVRRIYRMLPIMSDNHIAKIVSEMKATFPKEPSTYLLQPHLPSIPNVQRKSNTRLNNRLKILTLENESAGSTTNAPTIYTVLSQRQRTKEHSPFSTSGYSSKRTETKKLNKKVKRNVLSFDVDPNDPLLFSHCSCICTCSSHVEENEDYKKLDVNECEDGPSPPPNSRPSSQHFRKHSVEFPSADAATLLPLSPLVLSLDDKNKDADNGNCEKTLDEKLKIDDQSDDRSKKLVNGAGLETVLDKSQSDSIGCKEPIEPIVYTITRKKSLAMES